MRKVRHGFRGVLAGLAVLIAGIAVASARGAHDVQAENAPNGIVTERTSVPASSGP
jgi:hypothetical protein